MEFLKNLYLQIAALMHQTLWTYNNTAINTFTLFCFFLVIYFTVWTARLLLKSMSTRAERGEILQRPLIYRLSRLLYYSILVIGFLIALSFIGFDFTSFVWIASALGVGLGFGLQPIFNNFLSGIILLYESELKIGDYIELESGVNGEIQEINFRTTTLYTQDGIKLLVPNALLINAKVAIDWTISNPMRCLRIPFSLPIDADQEEIKQKIIEAAQNMPSTYESKQPTVYLIKLTENSRDFELWVWVKDKEYKSSASLRSDYLSMIQKFIA